MKEHRLRESAVQLSYAVGFIALSLLFDWASYVDPLFGLNITPWNPDPALGLVYWLRFGRRAALPWFISLVLCEWLVRGLPAGFGLTLLLSAWLVLAYGLIGEALRRRFSDVNLVNRRRRLMTWLGIVVPGLLLNGAIYVGLLGLAGLIPHAALPLAIARFAIGDVVGVVVSMPLLWMLALPEVRGRLTAILWRWETLGYVTLCTFVTWGVFNRVFGNSEFQHFYFLFLPVIWAAARHGIPGTNLIAFILQLEIIAIFRWGDIANVPFSELQLLGAAVALVGFFIGVTVDEQRQAADELKYSLRLAAAGEMAAALAHELNQPVTALSAYGTACQHMLARGETGPLLLDTMHKMMQQAGRVSSVVRRLREFFRAGAMHLETFALADLVGDVVRQFDERTRQLAIAVTATVPPQLRLQADRLQIELVVRNLVANAIDAVSQQPDGKRHIAVVCTTLPRARLQVTVADSGPGVPPAVAARLFEPFVSGKSSGLGLGLVLCRAIVQAHGGDLWAEAGGKGIFKFNLPAETGASDVQ